MLNIQELEEYFHLMTLAHRKESKELVDLINERLALLRREEAIIHTLSDERADKVIKEIRFMNLILNQFKIFEEVFKHQCQAFTGQMSYYETSITEKSLIKDRDFWKESYFIEAKQNLEYLDIIKRH